MRKGYINRGVVKRTRNQEKKHYSQFTLDEILYLENKIRTLDLDNLKPSFHLLQKKDVCYKIDDIKATLKDINAKDMIIEYNCTKKMGNLDKRLLFRSKEKYDVYVDDKIVKCNLCFVISIIHNEIVTVYLLKREDPFLSEAGRG